MGIRRARVTWFAVISGRGALGTTAPYHADRGSSSVVRRSIRARAQLLVTSVTQFATTWVSAGSVSWPSIRKTRCSLFLHSTSSVVIRQHGLLAAAPLSGSHLDSTVSI